MNKDKQLSGEGHGLELQVVDPRVVNITRALQFPVVIHSIVIPLRRFLFCTFENDCWEDHKAPMCSEVCFLSFLYLAPALSILGENPERWSDIIVSTSN